LFTNEERERIEAENLKTRKALEETDAERKKKGEGFWPIPPGF